MYLLFAEGEQFAHFKISVVGRSYGPTLVTTFSRFKGFSCHCAGHLSAAASALWDKPVPGAVGWYLVEHPAEPHPVKSCGPPGGSALTASGAHFEVEGRQSYGGQFKASSLPQGQSYLSCFPPESCDSSSPAEPPPPPPLLI